MRSSSTILPLLSLFLAATLAAPGVGNAAAVNACNGFPNGALKCLTDVSYTVCFGDKGHGYEQEYFVAPGTHCEQGIIGKKIDAANVMGVATATQTFLQFGIDGHYMWYNGASGAATSTTAATLSVGTGKLDSAMIDKMFATTQAVGCDTAFASQCTKYGEKIEGQ